MVERLKDRKPLSDLRLGQQDGITAAAFYSSCAASLEQQVDGQRADLFVLDKDAQRSPPEHRLIRLELLSFVSELPHEAPSFTKHDSALSSGAKKMLALLWRQAKSYNSWAQGQVCVTS